MKEMGKYLDQEDFFLPNISRKGECPTFILLFLAFHITAFQPPSTRYVCNTTST